MSNFHIGTDSESTPRLGAGPNPNSESDSDLPARLLEPRLFDDPIQQHPVAQTLVGHIDPLFDVTQDNTHAISDQPSLGLWDYLAPASPIENTDEFDGFHSLLKSYMDGNADNRSDSGTTDSSIPAYATNVCFTFRFVIC